MEFSLSTCMGMVLLLALLFLVLAIDAGLGASK